MVHSWILSIIMAVFAGTFQLVADSTEQPVTPPSFDGSPVSLASPSQETPPASQTSAPPTATSEAPVSPPNQKQSANKVFYLDTESHDSSVIGTHGNWMKKQEWLAAALKLQDQIQEEIDKIYGTRGTFLELYQQAEEELDQFYAKMGLEQGKLQELFRSIEKYLDKKRQQELQNLLNEKEIKALTEREFSLKTDLVSSKIKDHLSSLEQLKLDIKSIEDLRLSLAERLKKLDQEIDQSMKQGAQSDEIIELMWRIIDDKKAEEQYYKLKGTILESVKAVGNYLNNDLQQDFNNVIQTIKKQIAQVTSSTKSLEDEGIIIKNRRSEVEKVKQEKLIEAARLQAESEAKIVAAQKRKASKNNQTIPWYQKYTASIVNFFSWLTTSVFHSPEKNNPPKK